MRRYAVVGKPVRHSRSPWLHGVFARMTQRPVLYAALCPGAAGFAACCDAFFAGGGSGLNITLPYKADALAYAAGASAFAQRVGAANVLRREEGSGEIRAFNTDGIGLLRDLQHLHGEVRGRRVLLLGAGGAARAAAHALVDAGAEVWISNRTAAKAEELAAACGGTFVEQPRTGAEIVLNATSAGHQGGGGGEDALPPAEIFAGVSLAYDLSYGAAARGFLHHAAKSGAANTSDGSGMLAWQAAYSFALWEGVMPSAVQVTAVLRG